MSVCLTGFSGCIPVEEVGLARYYFINNSSNNLQLAYTHIASVESECDSCIISAGSAFLIGNDAAFGHAPTPAETILLLKIYRNDSLKLTLSPPFPDSLLTKARGDNEYDWDYSFTINNNNIH
jgi:hypothetical protein